MAACGTLSYTIQELASLALAVDEDESEEVDICLRSTDDHAVEALKLAFYNVLLYSYTHKLYPPLLHLSQPQLNLAMML